MKTATYNLIGNASGATGVIISIDGKRDGYIAPTIIDAPRKEFSVNDAKPELLALKAEGYQIVKGHDIVTKKLVITSTGYRRV